MRRPSLTRSVVRGLRLIARHVEVELLNGEQGSAWCETLSTRDTDDAHRALSYITALCDWFEARTSEREGADA